MKGRLIAGALALLATVMAYGSAEGAYEEENPPEGYVAPITAEETDSVSSATAITETEPGEDTAAVHGRERVGLVLSGGGAKGVAHVGVIKALEDNNIPIDYVTGTSMGAIVGSLYSCGWTPEQMKGLFFSQMFADFESGTIPKEYLYYYIRPEKVPSWYEVNFDFKSRQRFTKQLLPTSLISPLPMNIGFLEIYGGYSEQCGENFDNLFVPFLCVASDIYHKHKVVMSSGSLGDAVRASMTIPLVFKPIKIDGDLMYDGGIYDNFPVDVMREDFDPDFIIGVSVSTPDKKPMQGDLYSQVEDMVIQDNDYSLPAEEGVKIQIPLTSFTSMQFDKVEEIYEIGYKTGLSMVDSIKSRLAARRPLSEVTKRREEFAMHTPQVVFDSVAVTGTTTRQSHYLRYLFDQGSKAPFGMDRTINAYYRAVTDGTLNDLVPQAKFGTGGHNTLLLEASVKKPWSVGIGGWISTTTNNMLFVSVGYHSLNLNSLNIKLDAWVGQSYQAGMLTGRFALRTEIPSLIELQGLLSRQNFYDSELLFYEMATPSFITGNENYLRGNFIWAIGRKTKGVASLGFGYLSDSYYPDNDGNYSNRVKDKLQHRLGVLKVYFEKDALNNQLYPNRGLMWRFQVMGVYDQSRYLPQGKVQGKGKYGGDFWGSVLGEWKQFFRIHRHFSLGVDVQGELSLKELTYDYVAELVNSTAFAPTPSTRNTFNEAFRSNNYLAIGVMPVWSPIRNLQLRGDFYAYSHVREMKNNGTGQKASYDGWFKTYRFVGEIAAVYNLPFASISAYVNYLSYPSRNWNFGLNLGLYFPAPKLL